MSKPYGQSPAHPYFPSIPVEFRDLALYLQGSAPFLEHIRDGGFFVPPQQIVDEFWKSRSFKTSRRWLSRLTGTAENACPKVQTMGEALEAMKILGSSPAGILASCLTWLSRKRKRRSKG